MTIDEVIEAIEVEPFQPLEVTLRDGRRFPVVEQEHIQPTVEQGLAPYLCSGEHRGTRTA